MAFADDCIGEDAAKAVAALKAAHLVETRHAGLGVRPLDHDHTAVAGAPQLTVDDVAVIEWDGTATAGDTGRTTTTFEFEAVDDGARTLVTITESSWLPTAEGARNAFGNCAGWTGMALALNAATAALARNTCCSH